MQIKFQQTGGIMGLSTSLSLDINDLPAGQAGTYRKLLEEMDFFSLPENLVTHPLPDEIQYYVTVETDLTLHTVHASDTSAPAPLKTLIQSLSHEARMRRKNKSA